MTMNMGINTSTNISTGTSIHTSRHKHPPSNPTKHLTYSNPFMFCPGLSRAVCEPLCHNWFEACQSDLFHINVRTGLLQLCNEHEHVASCMPLEVLVSSGAQMCRKSGVHCVERIYMLGLVSALVFVCVSFMLSVSVSIAVTVTAIFVTGTPTTVKCPN